MNMIEQSSFENSTISFGGQYTKPVNYVFNTSTFSGDMFIFDNSDRIEDYGIKIQKKQLENGLDLIVTITNNSKKTKFPPKFKLYTSYFQNFPDENILDIYFKTFTNTLLELDLESTVNSTNNSANTLALISESKDITVGLSFDFNNAWSLSYDKSTDCFVFEPLSKQVDSVPMVPLKPGASVTFKFWFRAVRGISANSAVEAFKPYFDYLKTYKKPIHHTQKLNSRILRVRLSDEIEVTDDNPRGYRTFGYKRADTVGWNELLDLVVEFYGGKRKLRKYGYYAILLDGISGITYKNDIFSYLPYKLKSTYPELLEWKKVNDFNVIAGIETGLSHYDVYNQKQKGSLTGGPYYTDKQPLFTERWLVPNFSSAAQLSFKNNIEKSLEYFDGIISRNSFRVTDFPCVESVFKKLRLKSPEAIISFADNFSLTDCRYVSPFYSNIQNFELESIKLYEENAQCLIEVNEKADIQKVEKNGNIPITDIVDERESIWGEQMSSQNHTEYVLDKTIYTTANVVKNPSNLDSTYSTSDFTAEVTTDYINDTSSVRLSCYVKNISTTTKTPPAFMLDLQWNENDNTTPLKDLWLSKETVEKTTSKNNLFDDEHIESVTLNKIKLDTGFYGINANALAIGNGIDSPSGSIKPYVIGISVDLPYKCEFKLGKTDSGLRRVVYVRPLYHERDPDYTTEAQSRGNVFRKIRVPEKTLKAGEELTFNIIIKVCKNTDDTTITQDDVVYSIAPVHESVSVSMPPTRTTTEFKKRILGFDVSTNKLGVYNAITNPRGYVTVDSERGWNLSNFTDFGDYLESVITHVAESKSNFISLGYGGIALRGLSGFQPGSLNPKPSDGIAYPENLNDFDFSEFKANNPDIKLFLILNYAFKWYQPIASVEQNWKCDSKKTTNGGEYYLEHSVQFPPYRGGTYGAGATQTWVRSTFTDEAQSHFDAYFTRILKNFDGVIFDDCMLPHQDSCVNEYLRSLRNSYPEKMFFIRNCHTLYDIQYTDYYYNQNGSVSYPTTYNFTEPNPLFESYTGGSPVSCGIVEVKDPTNATEMNAVEDSNLCPLTMNVISEVPSSYVLEA